jgi:hypothetical protein
MNLKYLIVLFSFLILLSSCEEKINSYINEQSYLIKRDSSDINLREKILLCDSNQGNLIDYIQKNKNSTRNKAFTNSKNNGCNNYHLFPTKIIKKKYIFNSSFDAVVVDRVLFKNDFDISTSDFYEDCRFSRCEFMNGIYLHNCIFYKVFNIFECEFSKNVKFEHCEFKGNTNIDGKFNKIEFKSVSFDSVLDLQRCKFKNMNLIDVQLPEYLYFGGLNLDSLQSDIDFRFCRNDLLKIKYKKEKCGISLFRTDISRLILPHQYFRIIFNDSGGFDEISRVYESIIKKCNDIGMKESAEGWDIEYKIKSYSEKYNFLNYIQKDNSKRSFLPIGNLFIYTNKYWWNFGYNKNLIFRNTFISFIVCFMLFFLFLESFLKAYLPKENLGITEEDIVSLRINKGLRFKVSMFYTALIFFSWKMEHSQVNYKEHPYKTLCIYFVFTIGIVHLAYLAGAVLQ